jgi:hypothetical protein
VSARACAILLDECDEEALQRGAERVGAIVRLSPSAEYRPGGPPGSGSAPQELTTVEDLVLYLALDLEPAHPEVARMLRNDLRQALFTSR